MEKVKVKVTLLRSPDVEDWKRCLTLAKNTQGKSEAENEPSEVWKRKILIAEHSPIRTLMFTVKIENIPYYCAMHFVRHKFGVEHYVRSQRINPDRGAERQDAPVTHVMDMNAQALIAMARMRLCYKADQTTQYIMQRICDEIISIDPVYKYVLMPRCEYMGREKCREFSPCGMYDERT